MYSWHLRMPLENNFVQLDELFALELFEIFSTLIPYWQYDLLDFSPI